MFFRVKKIFKKIKRCAQIKLEVNKMDINSKVNPVRGVSGIIEDDIKSGNPYLICSWLERWKKNCFRVFMSVF